MSDAVYIDQAVQWSRDLTRMRTRGPGDIENAMRAIERDYGIDYWTLWQLRYARDRFKDIGISIYARLKAAYEAECQRQMRRLQHELAITEAIAGPDHSAVVKVKAVVGKLPDTPRLQPPVPQRAPTPEELEFPSFLKREGK